MKPSADIIAFQDRLGYRFADLSFLIEALTHPSAQSVNRTDNQRFEFLGDRVLGLVMAEALLERNRDATEGKLAPQFNSLVRKEACAEIGRRIDIGAVLRLGRSEMKSGGRRKEALLGDAVEAVLAAIYLDGGLDKAKEIILGHWEPLIETVKEDARDAKTALQEWAQARGLHPPKYDVIERSGPDHAPEFVIRATLSTGQSETAKGNNKRKAEHSAAKALLMKVEKT